MSAKGRAYMRRFLDFSKHAPYLVGTTASDRALAGKMRPHGFAW